jgi:SAM-dependent methyltransferase
MTLNPTIMCSCNKKCLKHAYTYNRPPPPEIKFDLKGQTYLRKYNKCTICSHWFAEHDIDLEKFYDGEYTRATYGDLAGLKNRYQKIKSLPPEQSDNIARVAFLNGFFKGKINRGDAKSVLDVGAGLGVFGSEMIASGWNFLGLELDELLVEHLTTFVGLEAIRADISSLVPAKIGLFDLVTLNKVLEHVENPNSLLKYCGEFITERGFIYLEVPDVRAAEISAEREEFTIEHHHVFSISSIDIMANECGMEIQQIYRLIEPSGKHTIRAILRVLPLRR